MNLEEIRALAAIVKENGLESLTLSEGDWSLSIKMPIAAAPTIAAPASVATAAAPAAAETPRPLSSENAVNSPMVGVFYAAPSPEATPYVSVGSRVKKGDVLCIIEAMKLMNEIQAEKDGEIVEVCVENGQVVEFGQPLFRLA